MNYKFVLILNGFVLAITAFFSTSRTSNAPPSRSLLVSRFRVPIEETYQGTTDKGRAEGKLIIKYEAAALAHSLKNESGNAEFSV